MAYLDENFLLHSPTARRLFHEVAKGQPIIDYHCHLSPREITINHRWTNLSEIWLGGDHYKWRLMRANGIDEDLITGDSTPREKFQAWPTPISPPSGPDPMTLSGASRRKQIHNPIESNTPSSNNNTP